MSVSIIITNQGRYLACVFCGRDVKSPETKYVSARGYPTTDWLKAHVLAQFHGDLDAEVTFGPSGSVRLCPACTEHALQNLDVTYILHEDGSIRTRR